MKKIAEVSIISIFISIFFMSVNSKEDKILKMEMKEIKLSKPETKGNISLEECIKKRRSIRRYLKKELSMEQISKILWAGQGITDERRGLRSVPSAGATYPLELYLVKSDGVFKYIPENHSLVIKIDKNIKKELADAALGQSFIEDAGISIIICAKYERTTSRYGKRGIRYVDFEAGHCAQNICLMAVSCGLATVPVGAFSDIEVKKLLKLNDDIEPIYIIPIGYEFK